MKKFRNLMILGLAIAAFSFTSCKKDYTCTCTTTVEGLDPVVVSAVYENVKKSDATEACDAADAAGGDMVDCVIE